MQRKRLRNTKIITCGLLVMTKETEYQEFAIKNLMTLRFKWLTDGKVENLIHKTRKFSSITTALLEI